MYIDTHTKEAMEQSICSYLCVTPKDLRDLFEVAGNEAQQDKFIDGDKLNEIFNSFIKEHLSDKPIDEVLFFHLSRRLNTAEDCNVGNNLFDLLSTDNAMSLFLKEHDVEFAVLLFPVFCPGQGHGIGPLEVVVRRCMYQIRLNTLNGFAVLGGIGFGNSIYGVADITITRYSVIFFAEVSIGDIIQRKGA